jgi:hypothetical protein
MNDVIFSVCDALAKRNSAKAIVVHYEELLEMFTFLCGLSRNAHASLHETDFGKSIEKLRSVMEGFIAPDDIIYIAKLRSAYGHAANEMDPAQLEQVRDLFQTFTDNAKENLK